MKFELNTCLDKVKVSTKNEEEIVEKIKDDLSSIISQDFTIYEIDNKDDIYGYSLGIKSSFYCGENESYLGLELIFKASASKELFEAIYNTFEYLSNLTSSKRNWSIRAEYSICSISKNKKFSTLIREEQLRWDYTNYGDIDIMEILRYIAVDKTSSSFAKENYLQLEKEIENKEKYKHILKDIKKYNKKNIPFKLKNVEIKKYNDIDIILSLDYTRVETLIENLKQYKEIVATIIKVDNIPYNYINTDFSKTTIERYTIIDQEDNLFYILKETNGLVDDICSNLYLFDKDIEDEKLQEIVRMFD